MAYTKATPHLQKGTRGILARSWWVVLFVATCAFVYFHNVSKKKEVIAALDSQISSLDEEKRALSQEREDLLLQISSQSDPDWIRLTLMKGLGLVPEGQLKVYFYKDER